MVSDTIDGVLIDCDEDGFHLILSGHEEEYDFRIQGVASELLRAVQTEIGPWKAEGEAARASWKAESATRASSGAYEPSDPKSEGYFDRAVVLWDER